MLKRWFSSASVFVSIALVAAACGGGAGPAPATTAPTTAPTAAASPTPAGEIIIASNLPTSGADASDGLPTQNGVQFAVESTGTIKGFKLTFKAYDDTVNGAHDPQKGAQNVQQMLSDAKTLGMVGPFNSNVAQAEIPIGNRANFPMISPSNTNECLTQTFVYCSPSPAALRPGGPNNYFRIAAADTFQGPAMADYAFDTLKFTKIAVWTDNETFGKGVGDNFAKEFVKKGGTVVVRQDFDTKSQIDWRPFITDAKSKGAQAIYAAATSGTKVCVPRGQMKGLFDVPYLVPDGGVNAQCLKDSGDNTANMYGTSAAADANQNPDAKATIDAFKVKFSKKEDVGSYTFAGYDCAKILIDSVGRAIDAAGGKMPTREQVRKAVTETKGLKLTTGTYSFDANGDPTSPTMVIWQTKGTPADWSFIKQFGVGG